MKRFLVVLIMLSLTSFVSAKVAGTDTINQGYFKKKRNGDIVQYGSNGKKMHIFKMKNGKVVKIK